jgi:hypothetical protein
VSVLSGNVAAFLICLERVSSHTKDCQVVGPCERGEQLVAASLAVFGKTHPREKRRLKPIIKEHLKRLEANRDAKFGRPLQPKFRVRSQPSDPYVGLCPTCGEISMCREGVHGEVEVPFGPHHTHGCVMWREHAPKCDCKYCQAQREKFPTA